MRFLFLFLLSPLCFLSAQPADVESLLDAVDLSILEKTPAPSNDPEEVAPVDHLFLEFEQLPLEDIQPNFPEQESPSTLKRFSLPEATYLIVPNTARIDQAYLALSDALKGMALSPTFPLKIVLHADGNFSVAIALKTEPNRPLPLTVDLSPLPETHFAAVEADIQLINKEQPPVLEAFTSLLQAATAQGIKLDRSEFYYFPLSPGKVLFALRVK